MELDLLYLPSSDSLEVTIEDKSMTVSIADFWKRMPQTERPRLEYLLSELFSLRKEIIADMGEYSRYILELTKGIAKIRMKQEALDPDKDAKAIKSLGLIVTSYSSEKNTLREMRHAIKLQAIEEGRLLSRIAEIEL